MNVLFSSAICSSRRTTSPHQLSASQAEKNHERRKRKEQKKLCRLRGRLPTSIYNTGPDGIVMNCVDEIGPVKHSRVRDQNSAKIKQWTSFWLLGGMEPVWLERAIRSWLLKNSDMWLIFDGCIFNKPLRSRTLRPVRNLRGRRVEPGWRTHL